MPCRCIVFAPCRLHEDVKHRYAEICENIENKVTWAKNIVPKITHVGWIGMTNGYCNGSRWSMGFDEWFYFAFMKTLTLFWNLDEKNMWHLNKENMAEHPVTWQGNKAKGNQAKCSLLKPQTKPAEPRRPTGGRGLEKGGEWGRKWAIGGRQNG